MEKNLLHAGDSLFSADDIATLRQMQAACRARRYAATMNMPSRGSMPDAESLAPDIDTMKRAEPVEPKRIE